MTPIIKPALLVLSFVIAACGQAGARDAQLTPGQIDEISGPLSVRLMVEGEAVELRPASLVTPVPDRTEAFLTTLLNARTRTARRKGSFCHFDTSVTRSYALPTPRATSREV